MPSAEDEERAVFDDDEGDDDYTEGDDSELDDDDDTEGDDDRAPPSQPQQPPKPAATPAPAVTPAPAAAGDLSHKPSLNPSKPNISAPAAENGAFQALPLSAAVPELKIEDRRALVPFDDSRRLFQRLWTDDDEIKILQGFLEFTTQRGTTFASHQYDTGPFYEQIKRELQLDFTKNQLIEKLRRLKKKFRNAAAKFAAGKEFVFKSPHDKATFDISRKIWSVSLKRTRDSDDDDLNTPNATATAFDANTDAGALSCDRRVSRSRRRIRRRIEETAVEVPVVGVTVEDPVKAILAPPSSAPIPSLIEETVRSCLGPLFKELLNSAIGAPGGLGLGGLVLNSLLPLGFEGSLRNPPLGAEAGSAADEKWRKQQILELEVYLKRIDLLQDQIKSTLEELKSSPGN